MIDDKRAGYMLWIDRFKRDIARYQQEIREHKARLTITKIEIHHKELEVKRLKSDIAKIERKIKKESA